MLSNRILKVRLARQIRSGKRILYRSFIGMSFLAIICCGKKVEDSDKSSGLQRYESPISTDLEQALANQQLSCEPGAVCPNYMGLINVVEKGQIRSCTSFLVDRDVVATSASCLPPLLRLANQDCSKDLHIYFASVISAGKTLRLACDKVVGVSDLKSSNPVRWRDDVAFIKLKESLPYRRMPNFSRKGFNDFDQYSTWYVSRMDEKTAFIKRESCRNIQSSYINPFASNVSSPNILVSDCGLSNEATGAPLLDRMGQVRGMISTKMSSVISDYLSKAGLLVAPLKPIFHGSSFACAPTIFDTQVLDEVECLKDMSQVALDKEMTNILNTEGVFETTRKKLEQKLNQETPYLQFQVSLTGDNHQRSLSFSPRCFKPFQDWINTVESTNAYVADFAFPVTQVKKSLDTYGRLFANVIQGKAQKYNVQFSVRNLKRYANSRVYFWNDDFNFNYPRLTANCQ